MRGALLLTLPLLLAACAGLGKPTVPGQFTQACANGVIGGDAPPALLVQVRRSAVRAEHDAYFVDGPDEDDQEGGRVALTRLVGPATARHEAARQAAAQAWGRPPTPREFRDVERRCGAAKRRGLG